MERDIISQARDGFKISWHKFIPLFIAADAAFFKILNVSYHWLSCALTILKNPLPAVA